VPPPATGELRPPPTAVAAQTLPSAAAPVPAPLPQRVPTPAPGTLRVNAQGYTVGDKWNYQTIDRYKGEVVRNWALQVTRINPDGSWLSGSALYDASGRLRSYRTAEGDTREYIPFVPRWWPGMEVGGSVRLNYEQKTTSPGGTGSVDKVRSEAKALRRETVRVPAGSFDTIRVEVKGRTEPVGRPGYGHHTVTYWYTPELHTLVAVEQQSYWNGKLENYSRDELTSLRLITHPGYR